MVTPQVNRFETHFPVYVLGDPLFQVVYNFQPLFQCNFTPSASVYPSKCISHCRRIFPNSQQRETFKVSGNVS